MQCLINVFHDDAECANRPHDYTWSKFFISSQCKPATLFVIPLLVYGTAGFSRLPALNSMDSSSIPLLLPH